MAGALWAVLVCLVGQYAQPGFVDWRYFWTAGHAVVQGLNPYAVVDAQPGNYPLFYPGPAVVLLVPFGLLPIRVAWVAFAACSGAAFGLAAQRWGRGLWVGALSACFLEAIIFGQWSPLMVGAAVVPALGFLFAAKPSIGLALFALRPTRHAVGLVAGLTAISLVLLPSWPRDWLAALQHTNHVPPVLRPYGWLLLLAFLRWETPEGRMLGLLALVPQTTSLYEALPLFLIPRHRWEGYGLTALSFVVAGLQGQWDHRVTIEAGLAQRWPVLFGLLYLPALWMVLTRSAASTPAASPCR